MNYDLVIKDGLIVDGSGMPAYRADVGVAGGGVAALGEIAGGRAR
jgi:N-acyl-D-aspartate/D-glutamate deacylase